MEEHDGGKYKHEVTFNLKHGHYSKFLKKQGFELSPEDLANENDDNKVSISVHPNFHKRYRHALRHKKSLRIMKTDYDKHFIGSGEKKENIKLLIGDKKKKKTIPTDVILQSKKEAVKASLQPDNILLPHGQLLRGVHVQGKGEYQVPLKTDHHTFATKQRIKE